MVMVSEFAAPQAGEIGFRPGDAVSSIRSPSWWLIRFMAKPACSTFQAGFSSA